MATLKKMTRMGADVRQIARLLQEKAPEGHMLAYITPEEAKLLKSQGGSGKEHADTGIPSFEVDDYSFSTPMESYAATHQMPAESDVSAPASNTSQPAAFDASSTLPGAEPYMQGSGLSLRPSGDYSAGTPLSSGGGYYGARPGAELGSLSRPDINVLSGYTPSIAGAYDPTGKTQVSFDTTPEKGVMVTLVEKTGLSKETLSRLGLAGGLGVYGAYQSKKAQDEARKSKEEQQKLAAPYRQQGAELQRQAQAGELTPVGQQQLQAVQAQAAQQASGRGGAVSAAQTQAQIENFRNQLLQQQYDYGLKLSGIGDNIALGAIKTGLEADRYVQNLSNSFYTNMANIAGGMPAQAQAQQRTA